MFKLTAALVVLPEDLVELAEVFVAEDFDVCARATGANAGASTAAASKIVAKVSL